METKNEASEPILEELKAAYKSINALKETPAHRKIALALARKMRQKQK